MDPYESSTAFYMGAVLKCSHVICDYGFLFSAHMHACKSDRCMIVIQEFVIKLYIVDFAQATTAVLLNIVHQTFVGLSFLSIIDFGMNAVVTEKKLVIQTDCTTLLSLLLAKVLLPTTIYTQKPLNPSVSHPKGEQQYAYNYKN